jgi:hypothetical protein
MRYLSRIIMAAICLIALGGIASAGWNEPSVRVSVDKRGALIGDKITYVIEVNSPKGVQVELPKFKNGKAGDFEIKDSGATQEKKFFGGTRYKNWYALAAYEPGKYKTPAAAVRFRSAKTDDWKAKGLNQIEVTIDSVLPKGKTISDIKDIKPPIQPFSINYWLVGSILAALAVAWSAVTSYIRYKNRLPPRSPYEIAVAELEEAKVMLNASSDIKEYYVKVSDSIRRYIENVFKLRAPEMTTQEFLGSLQAAGQLPAEYKGLLKEFMEACDLVKFAKYLPVKKEAESVLVTARNFIDGTKGFLEEKVKEKR